jgi:hypothetical protein
VAEGAGLDAMFRLMSRELGAECWLLTGLGRVIGGTGPSLPRPLALRLACEYLRASRMPVTEVSVAGEGAGQYSLFGVGGEPRITGWFLACAGSEQDWPHELRESVAELAADVALERARLNAARTGDGKLAEAIVTMLASGGGDGAAPAEIASLMRAAGLPPDGRYLVAVVTAETDRVTGPNAERWRCDLAGELVRPAAEDAMVAPLGDEIVVLVPAPGDGAQDESPDDGVPAAHRFAATIRAAQPVVESDRSGVRLAVGVSGPAESVTALPGALHEAGSARRLAALRLAGPDGTSAISVVTSDEVASHELLLATVPASVLRSFRERLLGPLLAYDDQHRAELLPTLREFLACSGSWNVCAARMYVHVNTVRYRIRRIEELTGRDLSRLDDQVDFFLALRNR